MKNFGEQHHSQPGAIYISQCTELGTIYTVEELKALTGLAHEGGYGSDNKGGYWYSSDGQDFSSGESGFSDFFESLFGGRRHRESNAGFRGQDYHVISLNPV